MCLSPELTVVTLESVQCMTEWQGEGRLPRLVRSPGPPHLEGGLPRARESHRVCLRPSSLPSQEEERPPASLQTCHWWAAPMGLGKASVFRGLIFSPVPFLCPSVTWCSVFTLAS